MQGQYNQNSGGQLQYQQQHQYQAQQQSQMQQQMQYKQLQQQQNHASKNGNAKNWRKEIFYCLGTDFLSLTFGNYSNGQVSFNNSQVMECTAGNGAFLDSNGKLACSAHSQSITHSTQQPILYIHASKILAVRGECISPKGQVSTAPTLYQRHSIYVQSANRQTQSQYQQQSNNIVLK